MEQLLLINASTWHCASSREATFDSVETEPTDCCILETYRVEYAARTESYADRPCSGVTVSEVCYSWWHFSNKKTSA